MLSYIWTSLILISLLFGILTGHADAVAEAAVSGASTAIQLCLAIGGAVCLWSGVLEIMKRSGLTELLARMLKPVLSRLFPDSAGSPDIMSSISANVSANLLGLGNAATPAGIAAVGLMAHRLPDPTTASDDMCMLVVLNTASLQLIPVTVAGIRASAGAERPFDILPAVLLSSAISVISGIVAVNILRFWSKRL